jgi:glycosyltransferase involved in cell wall biosynthesis
MAKAPTLSVCMIVKNEEKYLPRILSSLQGLADEVIVVDTGSKDATADIARSFGAQVHFFEWCGDFSKARNESLKYATKNSILWVDADDEIKKEDHQKIRESLRKCPNFGLFLMLNSVDQVGSSESIQLRIFPNHKGILFEGKVHEQVFYCLERKGIPTAPCDARIYHHGYEKGENVTEKLTRNRRILESELKEDPDNMNALIFLTRTLRSLGEPDLTLAYLDRVQELGEHDPQWCALDIFRLALLDKATILLAQGRAEETLETLLRCKSLFPEYVPLKFSLGEFYFLGKEYEKAFEELHPLMNEDFRHLVVPLNVAETTKFVREYLGISSLFVNRPDIAIRCFQDALDSDPTQDSYYHYLSLAQEKNQDIAGAIETCRLGLERGGQHGTLHKRLFLLLVSSGRDVDARGASRALNGCSNDLDVMTAMFLLSCRALNAPDIDRYYKEVQRAFAITPCCFPENLESTQAKVVQCPVPRVAELFHSAISFLMEQTS